MASIGRAILELTTDGGARLLGEVDTVLNQARDKVGKFARDNKQSLDAMAQVTGIVAGGVAAIGGAVVALGLRGSEVAGIRSAFDQLAASVGTTGDVMRGATRDATKGLITDLDIMSSANKALLLGLPVTAGEFADLAKTASILGRAMRQDATKSLDDLIVALGRSSPMILDNLGLSVKVGEANEAYARKLGKTADALTDAEKKTAFYNAAMDAARAKVAELGDIQLTFGDRVRQATVQLKNEADELGRQIAVSPVLAAGFDRIGDSLGKAFGESQADRIATVMDLIHRGAIAMVDMAAVGVESGRFITNSFLATRVGFFFVLETLGKIGVAFIDVQLAAARAAEAVTLPGLRGPVQDIIRQLEELKDRNTAIAESFGDTKTEALESMSAANAGFDTAKRVLADVRQGMVAALSSQKDLTEATKDGARAERDAGEAVALTAEQLKKLKAEQDKRAADLRAFYNWVGEREMQAAADAQAAIEQRQAADRAYFNWLGERYIEDVAAHQEAIKQKEADELAQWIIFQNLETEARQRQREQRERDRQEARQSLSDLASSLADLAQVTNGAFAGIAQWLSGLIGSMNVAAKGSDAMAKGFSQLSGENRNVVAGLVNITQGAIAAGAAMLQATAQGNTFQRTLGGIASGAQAGSAFGPWGTAIGAAIGGLTGLFRGLFGVSDDVLKVRTEVDKLRADIEKTATAEEKAEAAASGWGDQGALSLIRIRRAVLATGGTVQDAERLWRQLFDTDHPDAARRAIAEVNRLLDEEKRVTGEAADEAKRLADAQAAHQRELQEQIAKTSDRFSPLLSKAEQLESKLPKAIEAGLVKMRELGLITGQNADALSHLLRMTNQVSVSKMREIADQLGITNFDALGPAFNQGRIGIDATTLTNQLVTLLRGGADIGGILSTERVQQIFRDLGTEALRHHTSLPGQLRQFFENLNANDLLGGLPVAKLQFGDDIKTEYEANTDALNDLIAELNAGPLVAELQSGALIDTLGNNATIDALNNNKLIDALENFNPEVRIQPVPIPRGSGDEDRNVPLNFATGTLGVFGSAFANFGAGRSAVLHGLEGVFTPPQLGALFGSVLKKLLFGKTGFATDFPIPDIRIGDPKIDIPSLIDRSTRDGRSGEGGDRNQPLWVVIQGGGMGPDEIEDQVVRNLPQHIAFNKADLRVAIGKLFEEPR